MPPRRETGNKFLRRMQRFIDTALSAITAADVKSVTDEAILLGDKPNYKRLFRENTIGGFGLLNFAIRQGSTLLARCLLQYFEVDARSTELDTSGKTALHHAAETGHVEIMVDLVNTYHADMNAIDNLMSTPVHMCIYFDKPDALRELLRLGASVEGHNFLGKPLHAAAYLGHLEAVEEIYAKFPDEVNFAFTGKYTPLVCALYGDSTTCQDFLGRVSDVANLPLISKVALCCTSEDAAHDLMVRLLLRHADVDDLDQELLEEPAIIIAAKKNWQRVVKLLLIRADKIAGVEWDITGLLNHVKREEFLQQDLVRKGNKVEQLRPRIVDELRANNVLVATCICKALKLDMDEGEWDRYNSLCKLCRVWGMDSMQIQVTADFLADCHFVYFSQGDHDLALLAVKGCLALEPNNIVYKDSYDKLVKKLAQEGTSSS